MQVRRLVDFLTLCLNGEILADALKQLLHGESVKVAHHAVIVNDIEVRCREAHSKEVVILLSAGMVGISLGFLRSHKGCCCRAVMSIGNV